MRLAMQLRHFGVRDFDPDRGPSCHAVDTTQRRAILEVLDY